MNPLQKVNNFLVPASGAPSIAPFSGIAPVAPGYHIDWSNYAAQQGIPFVPQSVWLDNSAGTSALMVEIEPIGFRLTCGAGETGAYNFPAVPVNATAQIIGDGINAVSVLFSDAPVIPQGSVQASISGAIAVGELSSSGAPYQVSLLPGSRLAIYGEITAGSLSATLDHPTGMSFRGVDVTLSADSTLAPAGYTTLTISDDAGVEYQQNIYLPAAISVPLSLPPRIHLDRTFSGNLTIAVSTSLATGIIDVNAGAA